MRNIARFKTATLVIAALVASISSSPAYAGNAVAKNTRDLQWYLDAMQAEKMWKSSRGEGITVAVLDTGVDAQVPELRGRVLKGKNFMDPNESAEIDEEGHGTSMAALIAGTGEDGGIQGLAPEAEILPVTMTEKPRSDGTGKFDLEDRVSLAIHHAIDNGADIINMSFGSPFPNLHEKATRQAIDRAHREGVLAFAAAGNDRKERNLPSYPAAYPGVTAVAATDQGGKVAEFSTSGSYISLAAPGDLIAMKCGPDNETCAGEGGTSAATALVSASAALIWSKYPDWTANQVLRVLIETAGKPADGKVPSKYIGYGAVRPRIALADDTVDPGDPHKSPLFSKYYAEQEKKDSDAETPNEEHEPQGSDEDKSSNPEATASAEDSDGIPTLGIVMGGAVAALGGVVGFFLFRRWRSSER